MLLLLHAAHPHAWASLSSLHHIHCQFLHALLQPACFHSFLSHPGSTCIKSPVDQILYSGCSHLPKDFFLKHNRPARHLTAVSSSSCTWCCMPACLPTSLQQSGSGPFRIHLPPAASTTSTGSSGALVQKLPSPAGAASAGGSRPMLLQLQMRRPMICRPWASAAAAPTRSRMPWRVLLSRRRHLSSNRLSWLSALCAGSSSPLGSAHGGRGAHWCMDCFVRWAG